jgi:hypothetical protein
MLITRPAATCSITTRTKARVAQLATQIPAVCGRRGSATGPHPEPAESSPHPLPTTFTSCSRFHLRPGYCHIVIKISCARVASTFVLHAPPTIITLLHPINGFLNTTNNEARPILRISVFWRPPSLLFKGYRGS